MTDGLSSTVSISELSDEALNGLLAGDDTDTTTTEGDAVTTTDATTQAEPVVTDEQLADPNWKPEGPGDLRVAVRQAREAAKAAEAQAAEARQQAAERDQRLAEYQQREQQAAQQRQQQQYQHDAAQRNAARAQVLDDVYDPAQRAELLEQWRQEDLNAISQNVNQYEQQREYERGFRDAKKLIPDFQATFDKGMADPATNQAMNYAAEQALARGENPVVAAYDEAKRRDPAAEEARVNALVEKRLQEILQKQKPPDIKGHGGIAHISSESPGRASEKPLHQLSDDELNLRLGVKR